MIKLIASDLDGTLLQNEAQELTPRAIELIRALTQKGVHFVAASGRQYANERLLFHEIKDDISYIAENGSLCIHQGKVISRGLIEDDLAYRILRELKKEPGFEIVVSREDTCLIENNNSQFANHIVNVMHNTTEIVDDLLTVKDEKERETYLEKIEKSVQIYSAIVRTGNEILDTILTEKSLICENSGIHINCVADGSLLAFMNPVDLYTLFGNALDNAIEAVRKLESKEKRVIDIMLYERQSFLMLQIVNPMCGEVKFEDGLPLTTKAKNGYHGYGMKSMLHTIQKYEGHLTTEVKNGCFYFNVMLPLERDSNKK